MAQVTPFLHWPPEIRNAIYDWMFKPGKTLFLDTDPRDTIRKVNSAIGNAAFSATCRQVKAEAAPILYHQNMFRTQQISTWAVVEWLKHRNRSQNLPIQILIDLGLPEAM